MIWVWITIGLAISSVLFCKLRIDAIHFIWLLFMIDCYGIQFGGVTIKFYMLFVLFFFYKYFARGQKIVVSQTEGVFFVFVFLCFLISDLFNGFLSASIMQHAYFLVILVEAKMYCDLLGKQDIKQISFSILCSVIGFGIVYLFAYYTFLIGMRIQGVVSDNSTIGAMISRYSTMNEGVLFSSYRLHGFESDPNAFSIPFLVGVSVSLIHLLKTKGMRFISIFSFVISLLCIICSGSRSAEIIAIIIIILVLFIVFSNGNTNRFIVFSVSFLLIGLMVMTVLGIDPLTIMFNKIVVSSGRSSLTGNYGRLTIWRENFSILLQSNPFFGLGSNQIMNYSSLNRACHNTWLEWMCSVGILQGIIVDIVFLKHFFPHKRSFFDKRFNVNFTAIRVSYFAICIMLGTIDYIANSYFLFLFCIMLQSRHVESKTKTIGKK